MRKWVILLCLPLVLCGCDRGEKVDPVLFCAAYNRQVGTELRIREEDSLQRGEDELLLWSGAVLLRLLTGDDGAVQTAVVTAPPSAQKELLEAAQTAFAVLAEPLGEQVPKTLADTIRSAGTDVQTIRTRRFVYLVYALPEGISVLQVNSLCSPLPERPSLRSSEAR